MGADLHIHVMTEDMSEEDFRYFFSHNLGSKWFNPRRDLDTHGNERGELAYSRVQDSPDVWVGEWSPLKAGLSDNSDRYIPSPLEKISNIIGESLPIIDDDLIQKVSDAYLEPNRTSYNTEDANEVLVFLSKHIGKRCFTVSW